MTRENREEIKEKVRPKRVPVYEANRNKITVSNLDNENFMYRWVNDVSDRIAMFQAGGWELCDKQGKNIGDGSGVDGSRGTSSALSKGMGGGVTAYLMRIPKEIWLKDQQYKEVNDIAPLEAAMRKKANEAGDYGKVTIEVKKTS